MEENNTTQDTATEATPAVVKHTYSVVTGWVIEVESGNEWSARADAIEQVKKLTEGIAPEVRTGAVVTHKNHAPRWMEIPEELNLGEASSLLNWARANAVMTPIDWDEFGEEFESEDKWAPARAQLAAVPNGVFITWLSEGNGGIFENRYHLTAEDVKLNAEACEEQYLGAGSREEFTAEYYEDTGALSGVPSELIDAIDWDSVWYSTMQYDTVEVEDFTYGTHFFRNY
tara:strand:- start:468 stop:1154 length:687 start_codon:yes stop_codon:yes gene_type:complete